MRRLFCLLDHYDFFLRLSGSKAKIVTCPYITFNHNRECADSEMVNYARFRNRWYSPATI